MLQKAHGKLCLLKTQTYKWYKAFKEGREKVQDLPRAGRPSTVSTDENIEKIKKMIIDNRRLSVREVAHEVEMSHMSVHNILTEVLGIRRVAARLVPKELNFLQKEHRKAAAEDMISRVSSDFTFVKRIVTGDKTWVYEYDMQTSQQSSEYRLENEPNPKKPRQRRSKIKVMLTVFFDYRGVVHSEFLPDGQTVNKEYYLSVMRRLRENIRRKRPDVWKNNSWILHHDNAPSYTSILVHEFLAKNSTNAIEQAPYSPDMAPCDCFLFPKLKLPLRGRRFESIEAIKENLQKELKALPSSAFKKCFED
ncbi:Mariner Mos1 transposase [Anthophora retusa]